MKKRLVLLLAVWLLCLCGCGEKEEETLSGMPKLTVVCGEESVEAVRGTFEWAYPEKNGTIAHVIADALHPLEMKDLLTPLTITPSTFSHIDPLASYLLFDSLPPDSLQVYCWHDEQGDVYVEHIEAEKIDAKDVDSEAVSGFQIHLSEGSYIYEAVAQWGDGTQQGGKISYCFAANILMPVLQGIG